jgi:hypothetical protein
MKHCLLAWCAAGIACRGPARAPSKHDARPALVSAVPADGQDGDAAQPAPCTSSFDCGEDQRKPGDCIHECQHGRCLLLTIAHATGDACGGNFDGEYQLSNEPAPSAARVSLCDVAANLFCDPRKPSGAQCDPEDRDGFECARGTFCDNAICRQAARLGQPCHLDVAHRCVLGGYCDVDREICLAQRPNGTRCSEGAECRSFYCDPDTLRCAPRPEVVPCAY